MKTPANVTKLTTGPIGLTLTRLAAPMLVGILGMMAFNVIDVFFVGRLGTVPLAAITLTFPVVMVVGTFTLGLGVGAMAVISRGIGAGDRTMIRRYSTDALSLSVVCVVLLTVLGLFTIEPLFHLLGATEFMLHFVKQYMIIWYPGMLFYVVPIVGNNIIRATGDTVTPSVVMLLGVLVNAVLDPLFIFGWGPVPAMGISGAAIATVIARGLTLGVALWVLYFREHLLASPWPGLAKLISSWKTLLGTGLPVAVSNAIIPVALGIITRFVTQFGAEAVAGFGVATRIEGFGLAIVFALSTGISPFVGQNFGAGRVDRIIKGISLARIFSLAWGLFLAVTFWILARPISAWFNSDPLVVESAVLYLWIVPVSLGLRSIHQIIWTSLNVMGRPWDALILEFLLAFTLWIPFAWAGAQIAGTSGLYGGLTLANIIAGVIAYIWVDRILVKEKDKLADSIA
jgi:MATE family, multidrug efflux pump